MKDKKTRVVVRFTQQQIELLDKLKQEGRFGGSHAEIVVNLFRESIEDTYGKGGLVCTVSNE
ncbi:MAG: hypothetical protein IMZ61_02485 [Planctomycetes bacterium]|nr:hypothetical protein [Planctomycetota bacterium]